MYVCMYVCIEILVKVSRVQFPEAAKKLEERTYLDDIGWSRSSTEEVKHGRCWQRGSSKSKHGTRTARKLTKLVVISALQICLATDGTSMKTPAWKRFRCQGKRQLHKEKLPSPSSVGPYWPRNTHDTQVPNWLARAVECWLRLGRRPPRGNTTKFEGGMKKP